MTVSAIGGGVRFRSHQVGTQTVLNTPVAATRVLPYKGAIVVNPNRTDVDVDTGSVDPILPPTIGALDVTGTWDGPKAGFYDDLPSIYGYGTKGGVTPTGGATGRIWTYTVASLTADVFDVFTDEWGDDLNASDGMQAYGGLIDTWSLGFGEDLGAFDVNATTRYTGVNLATARTGALTVDSAPIQVFGGDTVVYVDTNALAIGITPWLDAVRGASVSWNNNLDVKRFANGSNNQVKAGGYGRGPRTIEIKIVTDKSTATMAERARIDDSAVTNEFIEIRTTSQNIIAGGATPYSNSMKFAARLFEVADGEIGGNATLEFTYRAYYDATLGYAAKFVVTNSRATL